MNYKRTAVKMSCNTQKQSGGNLPTEERRNNMFTMQMHTYFTFNCSYGSKYSQIIKHIKCLYVLYIQITAHTFCILVSLWLFFIVKPWLSEGWRIIITLRLPMWGSWDLRWHLGRKAKVCKYNHNTAIAIIKTSVNRPASFKNLYVWK